MKNKILFLLFTIAISFNAAFSAAVTWTGATSTDWATASNWSTSAVPSTTDDVTIPSGFTVVVSSTVPNINSMTVSGVLQIASGGSFTVNQTTTVNPLVQILAGEIRNAGTFTVTNTLTNTNALIRYNASTTADGLFENTGTLNLNNTGGTGACVFFNQNSSGKTAQFIAGGTINVNVKAQNYIFNLNAGSASIDGTATFGSASNYLDVRFIHIGGSNVILTLPSTANLTVYSKYGLSPNGSISASNTGTGNVSNAGSLTIYGGSTTTGSGIYLNPGTNGTTTFTNTGTITLDGNFPQGGIYLTGSTAPTTAVLNNQTGATINVNNTNTNTGTGSGSGIKLNAGKNTTVSNAGSISVATAFASSISIGDNLTTFNNTGTVTVNRNLASNTTGSVAGVFNNNTGGVFDFNLADNAATAINSNKVMFNNNGGTVTGRGGFSAGSFTPANGTLSPGNTANTIGIFTFNDASLNLSGNVNLQANGKTTAGTDFDQIASTGALDISGASLNYTTGGSYAPANGDVIPLVNTTALSGTFASNSMPTNWAMDYTTTNANALYTFSTKVSNNSLEGKILVAGKKIVVNSDSNDTMTIISLNGKTLQSATLKKGYNEVQTNLPQGVYIIRISNGFSHKVFIK